MILLLIFNGNTERFDSPYTIGVFVPFALSQTGMIRHWKKEKGTKFLKTCPCQYPWSHHLLRYRADPALFPSQ